MRNWWKIPGTRELGRDGSIRRGTHITLFVLVWVTWSMWSHPLLHQPSFYSERIFGGRNILPCGVRSCCLVFIPSSDVCDFMPCCWKPLDPTRCVGRKSDGQTIPDWSNIPLGVPATAWLAILSSWWLLGWPPLESCIPAAWMLWGRLCLTASWILG